MLLRFFSRLRLAVCMLLISSGAAWAQTAPFGLDWGMSVDQLRKKGVAVQKKRDLGPVKVYKAKRLPANVSIAEDYSLFVHDTKGLQKIMVFGKDITEDPMGLQGKESYQTFKSALLEKYGKPSEEVEEVGMKLYRKPDEFYECLAYAGCGFYLSFWELPEGRGAVSLEIKGLDRGAGFLHLLYEGPAWSGIVNDGLEKTKKGDKAAL